MKNYTDIFEPNCFYHIYNRAIGDDLLFYQTRNYHFFFDKFYEYLNEYLDFYAYCLLPNHFHFLVKVKETDRDDIALSDVIPQQPLKQVVSENFRRFAISYSQAINKQENRKGSLFMRPLKRLRINTETYLREVVFYIHHNPVHHDITENFENYKWSSYHTILRNKPTKIICKEVIEYFGDIENFIYYHKQKLEIYENLKLE